MRSRYLILAFIVIFDTVIEVLGAWKPFPGMWWTFPQAIGAGGVVLIAAVVWLFLIQRPAR